MAHDGWCAAMTDGKAEYAVLIQLERLGLRAYLPQCKRHCRLPGAAVPLVRSYPLFPCRLFLPLAQARVREIHYVRGLKLPRPFLNDADGRLWIVPDDVIFELALVENQGLFDETRATDDRVKLRGMELFSASIGSVIVELFCPLFLEKVKGLQPAE